jgi:glycosyltransferase involved in cell wall biosynthesis
MSVPAVARAPGAVPRAVEPAPLAPVGPDVAVVVPAYNEERTILDVIAGLRGAGFQRILVVDDGSTDDTALLARLAGVEVITHVLNRGLGAALGTGIRAALLDGAEVIATCDGDGQHAPADVRRALEPVLHGEADVVLGSRLLGGGHMPWQRVLANRIANVCTRALFGIWTTDSQCGLRVFSRKAAERLDLECDGMEVSSEIAGEIARNRLRCAEVPITSIYTTYSLSKGQSLRVGLRTLAKLLLRKAIGGRR